MTDPRNDVEVVARLTNLVGEGPVWMPDPGVLWWIDVKDPAVYRRDPASGAIDHWPMPRRIGCLIPRRDGGFLVGLKDGLHAWDPASGALTPIVDPEPHLPDNRLNDGACDRRGRLFVGSMDDPERPLNSGALYRFDDADGGFATLVSDVHLSNGIDWSPDDRLMYFADSLRQVVWAFDYDPETGIPSNRRVFASLEQPGEAPDGLVVDEEGAIWLAVWNGSRLIRYRPDGSVERTVALPTPKPTSMAFGGADLDTLYITTARADMDDAALAAAPLSGSLLAIRPGVRGLPTTPFAG